CDVVGKLAKQSKRVEMIVGCAINGGRPVFANIDAAWNCGPSSTLTQSGQPLCDRIGAVIVKSETINHRLLFGQSKDTWLGMSRLCHGGHCPDLDETKSKCRPCRQGNAVFVQPGGEANRVRKVQPKQSFGFRRRPHSSTS